MATKLYGTSIALPAPFVAGSCDPVDARLIVETFTDLTTNAGDTFGVISDTYCKVYEGLTVYVSDEKATYMYVGGHDANGILLTDVQNPSNWRKTSDELPQYTGSGAIAITGSNPNKVVSLTIDGTDQVLTQTVSGLKTNLTLNWSSVTGLQLVGKDSQVLATVPAADFIKDGMLQNVELTQLEGNATLVFTFNTDAGSRVVNVNVQDLVDVYTQGNGINIAGKVVTAVAKTSDPIVEVVATGIGTREDAVWDCGTY